MAYRKVEFHIHEEDFVGGLCIMFLDTDEGLIPFQWSGNGAGGIAEVNPISDDTNVVGCEVYGGTKEQFEHQNNQQNRQLKRRGKKPGERVHFPKAFAHKAGLVRSNITDRR